MSQKQVNFYYSKRSIFHFFSILCLCLFIIDFPLLVIAQQLEGQPLEPNRQLDVMDLYQKKHLSNNEKQKPVKEHHNHFSIIGAPGYSLQTGFAGVIGFNWEVDGFKDGITRPSLFNTNITYSQYQQVMLPLQTSIWTKNNKYNILGDYRYLAYPSSIFGLGGRTDPNKGLTINFNSIKFHQSILRRITPNFYAGLGFYFDYFWNIKAIDPHSKQVDQQFQKELGNKEFSIGPAFRALYDTRDNPINSHSGFYLNFVYHPSPHILGSDSSYQSVLVDIRNYVPFPEGSKNTLAFWMMDWLSQSGRPPYLLLSSTGWDETYNTGRGYIQGRFRGKNMVYFESEYRFGITNNGLLGGVLFANMQSFSSDISYQYSNVFPGYGLGLRVKINKFSKTNICIDYGFGNNNSQGFFINLGEVF